MMFYLHNGGLAMWMIGAASVTVTGIFLERLFHYRRAQIDTDDFLQGIYNVLKKRNPVEAISLCNETPGPVSKIVRAAVLHAIDPALIGELSTGTDLSGLAVGFEHEPLDGAHLDEVPLSLSQQLERYPFGDVGTQCRGPYRRFFVQ